MPARGPGSGRRTPRRRRRGAVERTDGPLVCTHGVRACMRHSLAIAGGRPGDARPRAWQPRDGPVQPRVGVGAVWLLRQQLVHHVQKLLLLWRHLVVVAALARRQQSAVAAADGALLRAFLLDGRPCLTRAAAWRKRWQLDARTRAAALRRPASVAAAAHPLCLDRRVEP
eukprot:366301-Chlamydomonas_euryale.AAC.15